MSRDESDYVFSFYAVRVSFLVNVDITIKLHKFSIISRWITTIYTQKRVANVPCASHCRHIPSPQVLRFSNFVPRSINCIHLIASPFSSRGRTSHLPKFSFSLQLMSVINMQTQKGIKTLL